MKKTFSSPQQNISGSFAFAHKYKIVGDFKKRNEDPSGFN